MDQKGRLRARWAHGRLQEALLRYRFERDALYSLLNELVEELSDLDADEMVKYDNLESSGTGLAYTAKGEAISFAVETLDELIEQLQNLSEHLDTSDGDPANIDLDPLFTISKV